MNLIFNLVYHAGLDVISVTAVECDDWGCVEAGFDDDVHHTLCRHICCLKQNKQKKSLFGLAYFVHVI